ncbi:hypothetical protein APHAL10511_000652 [Amanita phalloides]|nr:hypothetical protein APHAL10511_000652 [Amanita phalloides]
MFNFQTAMICASDNETDVSYDSSLLRPSPSMTSVSRTVPFQRLDYPDSSSFTTPSSLSSPSSSVVSTITLSSASGSSFASFPNRNRASTWARFLTTRTILPDSSSIIPEPLSGAPEQAPRASKRRRPDYRDIARKLDLLAKDFYLRDNARRQENRDIMDGFRTLRSQLRELRRHHQERTVVIPITVTNPRPQVSRSVGDSEDMSPLEYIDSGDDHKLDTLARSQSSNDASIGSFLSSHHSDEFVVETPS